MKLNLIADTLQIELDFWEQVWSVRFDKTINIPISNIVSVSTAEPQSSWAEIKAPGTAWPGLIKAGTYYSSRGKEFWYVTRDKDYLSLELQDEEYKRVILNVDNNESWAARIQEEISSGSY